MEKIAIIGAGISGLTLGNELSKRYDVEIFERESKAGGLIKCDRIEGNLFHTCGGHVFNSKNQQVLDWFWSFFDRDKEFIKADRNATVFFDDELIIPYPVENHAYLFNENIQKQLINDLLKISGKKDIKGYNNFEDFLRGRFGDTLYKIYFKPYNEKIWRRNLSKVPLSWLEGKLPMPTVEEIIYNNFNHVEEKSFVHSTFWYEKNDGSQFIVDRLAEGQKINYQNEIKHIIYRDNSWIINGCPYSKVVYCGNIKYIVPLLNDINLHGFTKYIDDLQSHGTTTVFCEIDKNPYSWIYQPSLRIESHRIICTGNFSESNNSQGKMTATIEFTDEVSQDIILDNLKIMPLHPKYITHNYNEFTYPIQDNNTRKMIMDLKMELEKYNFYISGRFAEWEYYNMDAAIFAALKTANKILSK